MKKEILGFMGILLMGVLFFIPSVTYSLYTGQDEANRAEPDFSPTRLIVKLKPKKVVQPDSLFYGDRDSRWRLK